MCIEQRDVGNLKKSRSSPTRACTQAHLFTTAKRWRQPQSVNQQMDQHVVPAANWSITQP